MDQEITVNGVKYHRMDEYDAMRENYQRALARETELRGKLTSLQATVDYDTRLISRAAETIRAYEALIQIALPIVDRAIGTLKRL